MKKKKKRSLHSESIELLSSKSPFSYSEAYKSLRTNIDFVAATSNSKIIMLTSALSGEGKTSVSINLAISLAQSGKKVVLVDCDLRRPKVERYLKLKNSSKFGVSTVLNGTSDVDSVIGLVEDLQLYVVLSGPIPPNPSELLASERLPQMLQHLAERFDYVICDTAPISIVTDAAVLGKHCDGALLVIRHNFATYEQVQVALDRLRSVDIKIFGTVVNQYNALEDITYSWGTYKYYGRYYGRYYGKYYGKSYDNYEYYSEK